MKNEDEGGSLFDWIGEAFGSLSPVLQFLILLGGAVGVVVAFIKWVRPIFKMFFSDMRAIRDTLVGRPAMHDSITNKEISGTALPSIGDRMASQETSMLQIAEAVEKLADATDRITSLEGRVSRTEDKIMRIETVLTDERILGKIESVQMFRTMEAVAHADMTGRKHGDEQVSVAYSEDPDKEQ